MSTADAWRDGPDGFFTLENRCDGGDEMADRLEALRAREAKLRIALAQERARVMKRQERERARLVGIVGTALIDEAGRSGDIAALLKETLSTAVKDERDRSFLNDQGWLA